MKGKRTMTTKTKTKPQQGTDTVADLDKVAQALPDRLRNDRLTRRMTWQQYAAFLGVPLSTLNKIVRRVTTKPHDLTVVQIHDRLNDAGAV
jgi:hypothetical protein